MKTDVFSYADSKIHPRTWICLEMERSLKLHELNQICQFFSDTPPLDDLYIFMNIATKMNVHE